jgi:hypothetical protein
VSRFHAASGAEATVAIGLCRGLVQASGGESRVRRGFAGAVHPSDPMTSEGRCSRGGESTSNHPTGIQLVEWRRAARSLSRIFPQGLGGLSSSVDDFRSQRTPCIRGTFNARRRSFRLTWRSPHGDGIHETIERGFPSIQSPSGCGPTCGAVAGITAPRSGLRSRNSKDESSPLALGIARFNLIGAQLVARFVPAPTRRPREEADRRGDSVLACRRILVGRRRLRGWYRSGGYRGPSIERAWRGGNRISQGDQVGRLWKPVHGDASRYRRDRSVVRHERWPIRTDVENLPRDLHRRGFGRYRCGPSRVMV